MRAIIIGIAGQDGHYLTELLHEKGYEVYGIDCNSASNVDRLVERTTILDLSHYEPLEEIIRDIRPDEIYYLAAHHFSSQGSENKTGDLLPFISVNLLAADKVLHIMLHHLSKCRFFYAASSHIFGIPETFPQTELTPQRPDTPYGISKSAALHLCRYYRETYGLYTSVGIMYNHESQRRGASFVTTQIARAAALAFCGNPQKLVLRSLDSVVDWGAAEDYVVAMWLTLRESHGDEYIIASGIPRTIRDFANTAFSSVNLNANDLVSQEEISMPSKATPYVGDSSKIRRICGWEPAISFNDMVNNMVKNEISRLQYK
jgi:GDPmannose 4,6-dehydratase